MKNKRSRFSARNNPNMAGHWDMSEWVKTFSKNLKIKCIDTCVREVNIRHETVN